MLHYSDSYHCGIFEQVGTQAACKKTDATTYEQGLNGCERSRSIDEIPFYQEVDTWLSYEAIEKII